MGLFDAFGKEIVCPACGTPGAKKFFGTIKCRTMSCRHYDHDFAQQLDLGQGSMQQPSEVASAPRISTFHTGDFDPGAYRVDIVYRNFRNEEHTYEGDVRTARWTRKHLSFCLSPTGKRVSFSSDRIRNLREVEHKIRNSPMPNVNERCILNFHKRRGSSSPLYDSLRRKYPDF